MDSLYLLLTAAFLQGIGSTVHCVSMCGPLSVAFLDKTSSRWKGGLFYGLGRLISYSSIGAALGLTGRTVNKLTHLEGIAQFSALLAFLILLVIGLQLIFPRLQIQTKWTEVFKKPIYPLFAKARALQNPMAGNFLVGLISGLLPCGVLYPAYAMAFGSGELLAGMFTMFIFFLGTFPGLYAFGIGYHSIKQKISPKLLPILGIGIIAFGLLSLYMRVGVGKPHCH